MRRSSKENENPVKQFVVAVSKHWKLIDAKLRAVGVQPIGAYEAALAQKKNMRFDVDLAEKFGRAYSSVQMDLAAQALEEERVAAQAKRRGRSR